MFLVRFLLTGRPLTIQQKGGSGSLCNVSQKHQECRHYRGFRLMN